MQLEVWVRRKRCIEGREKERWERNAAASQPTLLLMRQARAGIVRVCVLTTACFSSSPSFFLTLSLLHMHSYIHFVDTMLCERCHSYYRELSPTILFLFTLCRGFYLYSASTVLVQCLFIHRTCFQQQPVDFSVNTLSYNAYFCNSNAWNHNVMIWQTNISSP